MYIHSQLDYNYISAISIVISGPLVGHENMSQTPAFFEF